MLCEHLGKQLEADVVKPAQTEVASSIILVPKKDGTPQFYVDYRHLNGATIQDTYPLPFTDDCVDRLGESNVFTDLDALWGY